jgi:hypothetical protein
MPRRRRQKPVGEARLPMPSATDSGLVIASIFTEVGAHAQMIARLDATKPNDIRYSADAADQGSTNQKGARSDLERHRGASNDLALLEKILDAWRIGADQVTGLVRCQPALHFRDAFLDDGYLMPGLAWKMRLQAPAALA